MIVVDELEKLSLFKNVSRDQLRRFLRSANIREYKPRAFVFTGHDDHRRLYLLLEGVVKTYVTSHGTEQITNLFYPGDAFGGLIFGSRQDPRPWAVAMDRVGLISLSEDEFKATMSSHPDVCLNIFHYMVANHQRHIHRIRTLLHKKSSHRLVQTLLFLGERQGDGDAEMFVVGHGFTHEQLSNMIGVVRSTVSELMGELRDHGVVTGQGRSITVNRGAAYRFLEFDPEASVAAANIK